jgi:GGDEF domain-containing protein
MTVKKLLLNFSEKKLPPISFSAGLACYLTNGIDTRTLVASADKALYQAKAQGRDRVLCAVNG